MIAFLLRRVAAALVLLVLVLSATFFLIQLAPGDPTLTLLLDPRIPAEQQQRLEALYGLDRPLPVQYVRWLRAVAWEWDWGNSYVDQRPALSVVLGALPNTAWLTAGTVTIQYGLGILLGVIAALFAGRRVDRSIRGVSLLLYALPSFWLAILAVELLSVRWQIFPPVQMSSLDAASLGWLGRKVDLLKHLALPSIVLGLSLCGVVVRYVRTAMLDVLAQDYVRTARARGLSPLRVIGVHALPNALGPVIQHLGVNLPLLLSGALIIEVIFAWPGLGRIAYEAMRQRDYPVVLAGTAVAGALVVLGSLVADLLHAAVDPRIRARYVHG